MTPCLQINQGCCVVFVWDGAGGGGSVPFKINLFCLREPPEGSINGPAETSIKRTEMWFSPAELIMFILLYYKMIEYIFTVYVLL